VANDSFRVEDFIASITSQLDDVQDALVFKSLNRPLTYALKDLSLDLKVFVEMDAEGTVRFRTGGPNEEGASVVHLGFTTITRPMIEENSISLASTRSPSLAEAGLEQDDRRRLERLGVKNVAQLQRLQTSAGSATVSRVSDIPLERLKSALAVGKPSVTTVSPVKQTPSRIPPPLPPKQTTAPPAARPPVIRVAPGTSRLDLKGSHLIGAGGPPRIRLNKRALSVSEADDDGLIVDMPEALESGALEIDLPDGDTVVYQLSVEADPEAASDPWSPEVRR
jgi:hypothetical protein